MAELNQKLNVKKGEITEEITCYTTLEEAQEQGIPMKIEGVDCYAAYGEISDENASQLNYKKPDNTEYKVLKTAQIPYSLQGYYSPGTYSFTSPAKTLRISARAGGGAGGGAFAGRPGIGGSGGSIYHRVVNVIKGNTYAIKIGSGGAGTAGWGNPGGSSIFGENILVVTGGGGGEGSAPNITGANGVNGSPMESTIMLPAYGAGGAGGVGWSPGSPGAGGAMIIEWGGDIR